MKRWIALLGITLVTLAVVSPVHAQQPAAPGEEHHQPPAGAPAPRPGAPPQGGQGPMMPMEMCQQMMMGSHMGGMGMMGGQQPADPKMMAEMMEMRGEIMKAIGNIMIKHAKKMQGGTR